MTTYDVLKLQQALATGRRGLSRVDTMTLAEIIAAAKKAHACSEALAWARSCNSDEQFWAELKPEWAYCLRCDVPDLSPEVKAQAEAKACEEPQWACWLRRNVPDLSPEAQALAEKASAGWKP